MLYIQTHRYRDAELEFDTSLRPKKACTKKLVMFVALFDWQTTKVLAIDMQGPLCNSH